MHGYYLHTLRIIQRLRKGQLLIHSWIDCQYHNIRVPEYQCFELLTFLTTSILPTFVTTRHSNYQRSKLRALQIIKVPNYQLSKLSVFLRLMTSRTNLQINVKNRPKVLRQTKKSIIIKVFAKIIQKLSKGRKVNTFAFNILLDLMQ